MKQAISFPSCQEGLIYPSPFLKVPEDFVKIAQHADRLGYDAIMPNDHFTTQAYAKAEGIAAITELPKYFEPLTLLAYLAHATENIRLAAGTMIVPLRDPVLAVRQAITLDWLSGGRAMLATGVGGYRDSFDAMRPAKPRPHRGEITDEGLQLMRRLLDEPKVSFEGKHFQVRDIEIYPKPVQARLPIWVAGNHEAVVRRAARYGDLWYPACLPTGKLAQRLAVLKKEMEEIGRPAKEVEVRPQAFICLGRTRKEARERFRRSTCFRHLESIEGGLLDADGSLDQFEEGNLIGPPEYLIERLEEYRELGIENWGGQLFVADTVSEMLEVMEIYAEKVMARIS